MVGTGRFELPTPRTPSECSTRLSHVPTGWNHGLNASVAGFLTHKFYTSSAHRSMRRPHVSALPLTPPLALSRRTRLVQRELNLFLHRINSIHQHPHLLPQAKRPPGTLPNQLSSVL